MTEPTRDRVEELFGRAADLPPAERAAFLDAECGGDARLRADVEELLALDAAPATAAFLASPVVRPTLVRPFTPVVTATAGALPPPPAYLGRYRVIRRLGEGGMGVVYEAEQDTPRRAVAVKVLRPGLVSPNLLKRFANEAEILGRLQHPGVAQIFEAGVADDGQPFFAMEFVRGVPLDEYVRRHSLAAAARLELVARVCDAVHHAHERGVVHRDLKPDNVLVDDHGRPKVLDFGIARVAGGERPSATARTRTGQMIGTLGYMSPEQVVGDPSAVDGRTDVFALGVILYELFAHRPPYHLDDLPLPEAARVIREVDPPRLGAIDLRLRGDVETIVAKALEKEKSRRYPSAGDLAADLRRHLAGEAIRARPQSAFHHFLKFARRNKTLVGAVAAVAAALLGGIT
jgi:serine/threonine protein kinase